MFSSTFVITSQQRVHTKKKQMFGLIHTNIYMIGKYINILAGSPPLIKKFATIPNEQNNNNDRSKQQHLQIYIRICYAEQITNIFMWMLTHANVCSYPAEKLIKFIYKEHCDVVERLLVLEITYRI